MPTMRRILGSLVLITALAVTGGCFGKKNTQQPTASLQQMQQAMTKLSTVSYRGTLTVSGTTSALPGFGALNQGGAAPAAATSAVIKLEGTTALQSLANADSEIAITMADPAKPEQEITIRTKSIDGQQYVLMAAGTMPVPAQFQNKWLKLPKPEVVAGQAPANQQELTDEQIKQLQDLASSLEFMSQPREVGTETINGVSTRHYTTKLNAENIKKYMAESARITGTVVDAQQQQQADQSIDQLAQTEFELWVGASDNLLYRMSAQNARLGDGEQTATVTFVIDFFDHNKPLTIIAPTDVVSMDSLIGPALVPSNPMPSFTPPSGAGMNQADIDAAMQQLQDAMKNLPAEYRQ